MNESAKKLAALTILSQEEIERLAKSAAAPMGLPDEILFKIIPNKEETEEFQARWYAEHYTQEELEELIRFFDTPVVQKSVRLQHPMAQAAIEFVQGVAAAKLAALFGLNQEELH